MRFELRHIALSIGLLGLLTISCRRSSPHPDFFDWPDIAVQENDVFWLWEKSSARVGPIQATELKNFRPDTDTQIWSRRFSNGHDVYICTQEDTRREQPAGATDGTLASPPPISSGWHFETQECKVDVLPMKEQLSGVITFNPHGERIDLERLTFRNVILFDYFASRFVFVSSNGEYLIVSREGASVHKLSLPFGWQVYDIIIVDSHRCLFVIFQGIGFLSPARKLILLQNGKEALSAELPRGVVLVKKPIEH